MRGQGAELHCLDLKMGHFIPGAQKQKGALVAIGSGLRASLAAAGQPPPGRACSRDPGLSFCGEERPGRWVKEVQEVSGWVLVA